MRPHQLCTALCLVCTLGLVACATKPTTPALATQTHAHTLNLTGRLSLVVEQQTGKKQATTLAFTLQGNAQNGTLHLNSPLGNTLGMATWSPQHATLQQGKKTQTYASLADLLHATVGAPIPARALFDWLRGKNTPLAGWQVDLSQHSSGKIHATRLQPKPIAHLRIATH